MSQVYQVYLASSIVKVYNVYDSFLEEFTMQQEKKTTTITIKTTSDIKSQLESIATEKDWTVSKVCHNIIRDYLSDQQNNRPQD